MRFGVGRRQRYDGRVAAYSENITAGLGQVPAMLFLERSGPAHLDQSRATRDFSVTSAQILGARRPDTRRHARHRWDASRRQCHQA